MGVGNLKDPNITRRFLDYLIGIQSNYVKQPNRKPETQKKRRQRRDPMEIDSSDSE